MQTLNFLFNQTELKVYGTIENPIFAVNDICDIICVDNKSTMIMEIKNQDKFVGCNLQPTILPQNRCKYLAVINERGLYEILFRSNSKICEQFKDQIYVWLKEQRLQQNILKEEKMLQVEQLKKEFEKEKQQFEKEKQELNQQLQQERIDKMSREYNYRIIQFLDKRDGKLLYVIHFDQKYSRQKIQKIAHYLIGIGFDIFDIDQINNLNHYRKCDAREIVSEMTKNHRIVTNSIMV